jgi:hypothetical protein
MDTPDLGTSSHLFLLRLWPGKRPNSAGAWQGRVQHLASSEAGQFADWSELIAMLESLLAGLTPDALGSAAPGPSPSATGVGRNTEL